MEFNNDKIAQDGPRMRSVMIGSSPSTKKFTFPSAPRKIGATQEQSTKTRVPLGSSVPAWRPATPKELPEMYPLERSHVFVRDISRQEVANRISRALHAASFATEYNDETAMALAEGSCGLRFAIHLFDKEGDIVVEVQRRSGCGFQFRQASKIVLNASLGKSFQPRKTPSIPPIPSSIPKDATHKGTVDDGLKVALEMIKSDRHDVRILGMGSLEQITQNATTRVHASRCVLTGGIFDEIVSLTDSWKAIDGELIRCDGHEKEYILRIRRSALAIVANIVGALASAHELSTGLLEAVSSEALLHCLVHELQNAESRPHEACHAAKAIRVLVALDSVRQRVARLGVSNALVVANNHGRCRHAQLESETRQLQMAMGN